jgi:hypothetical protein
VITSKALRDIETMDAELHLVAALLDQHNAANNHNVNCELSVSAADLGRPRRQPA